MSRESESAGRSPVDHGRDDRQDREDRGGDGSDGRRGDDGSADDPDSGDRPSDDPDCGHHGEHDREEVAADLRSLLRAVETVHPDPFVGYGGRVALHARVERAVRSLPASATTEECYRIVAPVVAGLDDAHSVVRPPERSTDAATDAGESDREGGDDPEDRRLPVSLRVVGEHLYVEAVADDALADLVGRRLVVVEGVPVPDLVERGRDLWGSENRYGALDRAGYLIERGRLLARLLDRERPPARPTLSIAGEDPGDADADAREASDRRRRSVEWVAADWSPTAELPATVDRPAGPGPRYRLYQGGDVALFAPGNLSDYRESLEAKLAASPDAAARQAARAHERQVGGDPPDDPEETVAALPSMTVTVESMVEAMADAGTETLVVDLRDNPGGDSQFVFHLAYALQGWDGVARTVEGVGLARRLSDPYRRRYRGADGSGDGNGDRDGGDDGGGGDGAESAGGGPGEVDGAEAGGAYEFVGSFGRAERSDPASGPDGSESESGSGPVAQVRRRLAPSPTATDFLERVDDAGRYCPDRIVVVTSAGTMSSAFAGAAQLRSLGADVVGVPPGQAPVSFGEPVERTLPNAGLNVRLSGSIYRWIDDPDGDVLAPARELTPTRFRWYDRAADAGLRLAFEYAGHDDPGDSGRGGE